MNVTVEPRGDRWAVIIHHPGGLVTTVGLHTARYKAEQQAAALRTNPYNGTVS